MSNSLLSVRNLTTCFDTKAGELKAVDNVSLDICRGETLALLGESGCGKSMTAFSLMRLVPTPMGRISAGQALLDGEDLLRLPEVAMRKIRGNRIAMIFQEPMTSLNPVLTVGNQIAEAVRHHQGDTDTTTQSKVLELLSAVGIPEPQRRVHEYPHQLSGGMKQRVMIAMALAGDPEILIADEPTTALDVTIQAQVLTLLRELQAKTGMAILMITHDLGVVSEMADRVAVMYAGQIVEQASRDEFFSQPHHPYSRKLFDSLPNTEKRHESLAVIAGSVPSLAERFTGCRFADRCDFVWQDCRDQAPRLIDHDEESCVRCHLYDPGHTPPDSVESAAVVSMKKTQKSWHDEQLLLDVQDLKIHFPIRSGLFKRQVGSVYAVDGVSLEISKGRTLALVGESGCGKTTIGKGILQLLRPSAGRVLFDGDELMQLSGEALRQRRADIQIIFQDPYSSMNPRMMVTDIIQEGMIALSIETDKTRREARVDQLLAQVGLPADSKHRYPHEFSGGQRQRICIARALAVNPKLIICDEPTSALDISVQAQILNQLQELQQQMGLSYLFITHNLSVVAYLADEVAVMYLGRIVEKGRVEEVLGQARHPYTQALLSAIPVIGQDEDQHEVIQLEGDLPSPSAPPTGCHFHERCVHAMPQCSREYPAQTRFSSSHYAHCYLYQEN